MPFAPVIMEEFLEKYFIFSKGKKNFENMTMTCRCKNHVNEFSGSRSC